MSEIPGQHNITGNEIAVIGMAGRFPGAENIDEFWDNLKNGVESISFYSDEELEALNPALRDNPNFVKSKGGIIEDKEFFDASFFGYTPAEAEVMNPQLRIFHECVWEALENAGYDPDSYNGLIGLYAGASSSFNWELLSHLSGKSDVVGQFAAYQLYDKDFLSTRIAYKLNLKGPAITMHTACSTSLVAIHLASQAILEGECDIALAGGVTIASQKESGYFYQEGLILSPDGHCRVFDAESRGTAGGNGSAVVVLKSLENAAADGDYIYAVIKGSALNNDGINKAGYAAPSREGQTKVIRFAHQLAEVEPESITYIEAHGTGTVLGDPIEIEALKMAFNTDKKSFCALGSVKSNVGHLDSAAGAAGFIKAVLALKNRLIPPSLHYNAPNPKIDFGNSPFYVNTTLTEWKNEKYPLRAGVSSFGIGGTNAHVVLEEAPGTRDHVTGRRGLDGYQLILLSARTRTALEKMTGNLANHLKKNPRINLGDAAYTLQVGRKAFKYRRMMVCSRGDEAIDALASPDSAKLYTSSIKGEESPVVFMFSGQGSQYVNMGLELYRKEPLFRREVDRCFDILETKMGYHIKDILYPPGSKEKEAREKIDDVLYSGPVKFTFEYAMAALLMQWGIEPYAMIGHSFGEYAAAQLAGVFSLEDALRLVVLRGQSMQKMPGGAMMSVPLPEDALKSLLSEEPSLSLAAVNTPSLCIVSGPTAAVDRFEKDLNEKGYECLRINFPRASHSKMMKPIFEEFAKSVSQVKRNKPKIPYISGLTGNWISVRDAADPGYWARHLVETVRFSDGLKKLLEKKPQAIFVQMSSDRGLPLFVNQHPGITPENVIINLVRHPKENVSDVSYMLDKIGLLWAHGVKIDWSRLYPDQKRYRVPLPTYPFERKRYWIDGDAFEMGVKMLSGAGFTKKNDISDWFYVPSWIRSPLPIDRSPDDMGEEETEDKSNWLVFIDEYGLGTRLVNRFTRDGHRVIAVKIGTEYGQEAENLYTINHKNKDHYNALLKDLGNRGIIPNAVAHLWSVHRSEEGTPFPDRIDDQQDRGFCSLVYLAQAVGNQGVSTPLFIGVVTEGMQDVSGGEMSSPGSATIMGPVKVFPIEYSNINCRSIDILLPASGSPQEEQRVSQLAAELQAKCSETIVAYRGNHRWTQTFKPFRLEKPKDKTAVQMVKKQGVYMITGGLGGIGLALAEFIAGSGASRLVLTGRSPLPPKKEWKKWLETHGDEDTISTKIRHVQTLEEQGAEVLTFAADVTNQQQMEAVIHQVIKRFGQIDGVIHAAGDPGGGVIQAQTRETIMKVLNPKVLGTVVLNHVLKDIDLDFFLMCSSVSSIMSAFGQAGYCSANAFLDAFADYNTTMNGIWTTAVNWGRWKKTGMAIPVESMHKKLTGEELIGGMTASEGVEAFSRILGHMEHMEQRIPRIIAIESDFLSDWERFNQFKEAESPGEIYIEEAPGKESDEPAKALLQRPELSTQYTPPRDRLEQQLTRVWEKFFGIAQPGTRDDFFELGGDSLKALSLISMLHKGLNVKIPIVEFFKRPTIEKLAEYIKTNADAEENVFISIEVAEKKEYYALSSAQRRLYILQQMEPGNISYNTPFVLFLEGDIDKKELEDTFGELIARHESLRTSFEMVKEEPVQKVHGKVEFSIEYHDAGDVQRVPDASPSPGSSEPMIEDFVRPFNMSRPPLFRVVLIEIERKKHILMTDLHHIITDGISLNILSQEFTWLSIGDRKRLTPLRLQYTDYSEWQNRWKEKEGIKQQEEYWLDQFRGEIPVLNMPYDYPRPAVQSFEGRTLRFDLGKEETTALKKMASDQGVTSFMMIFSIVCIMLSKISSQEDIIIGTDTAGRNHPDLESVIGMFVNTLPLRNFPAPQKTFNQFLGEVKERTLKAFDNQGYQFEDMVERIDVERDFSRNPLFDVMFSFDDIPAEQEQIPVQENPDSTIKPHAYENRTAKFDLMLTSREVAERFSFSLEYCTKLFQKETIQRYISYFKQLVSSVIADAESTIERKISGIEIIPEEEKKQVLADFNANTADFPQNKTICHIIEHHSQRTPNSTAIACKGNELTYDALNKRSNQLARLLRERGISGNQLVGVLCERSIEMVIGILSVWKAGGGYIPIDINYPFNRIDIILADSGAEVLLTTSGSFPGVNQFYREIASRTNVRHIIYLDKEKDIRHHNRLFKTHRDSLPRDRGCDPEQNIGTGGITDIHTIDAYSKENPQWINDSLGLSYVIYTSGSTGKPKGAMVEHLGMMNHLQAKINDLQLTGGSIVAQNASHTFDISIWQFFAALMIGGKTIIYPEELVLEPEQFISQVIKDRVTILEVVPSYLSILLTYLDKRDDVHLPLRYLLVTGEEVKPTLVRKWFEKYPGIKMVNAYGPTEASDDITHYFMANAPDGDRISIGKPLQNLDIYIVDKHMKLCPIGVKGEICVSGVGVGRGYLNSPERTAEAFIEDAFVKSLSTQTSHAHSLNHSTIYKTGDLGRWLADGTIEFFGRMDYQEKIRGFRIELGEIELKLASHPEIKDTVVIAAEAAKGSRTGSGDGNKYLCSYFVSNSEIPAADLREYLMKELPGYMIPSYFIRMDKIPLTPNGKIDRKALPEPEIKAGDGYAAPRNPVEEKLAEIWADILGNEKESIGIDSNFFELGGHSLKATLLAARIHKAFNVRLPIAEIFRTPVIRTLSEYIEAAAEDKFLSIQVAEEKEYYALSSAQNRLFFMHLMKPKSTAYNVLRIVVLQGDIDKDRLEKAFTKLSHRHQNLRTSYMLLGKEPVQKIHKGLQFKIEYIDLSNTHNEGEGGTPTPPQSPQDTIKNFVRPFDLTQGPLLRIGLVKEYENRHILAVDIHHIITDGVSDGLLVQDFMSIYAGDELPPLKLQYRDFSEWQNRLFRSDILKKQEEYWLNRFKGDIPVLNLPMDYSGPPGQAPDKGAVIDFTIDRDMTAHLYELLKETGTTTFMVLLAIFDILLSKYTGQEDIVIGAPVTGRRHHDLQGIIGMFVNMLVMRNRPRGNKTFREFLEEVKENALNAYGNQDYQFDELIRKLGLQGDSTRNPLFNIVLEMQNITDSRENNDTMKGDNALQVYPYGAADDIVKAVFDMILKIYENNGTIDMTLLYSSALFKKSRIERMVKHYAEILQKVIENKDIILEDITVSHSLMPVKSNIPLEEEGDFAFS